MKKVICTLSNQIRSPFIGFTIEGNPEIRKASRGLTSLLKKTNLFYPGARFVAEVNYDSYKVRPYDLARDGNLSKLQDYLRVIEEERDGLTRDEYILMRVEAEKDIERMKKYQESAR